LQSLEQFVEHVARRGSWFGGGSVAALSAALAAALLEKLIHNAGTVRALRGVRRECLALIRRDADAFARVIRTTRRKEPAAFQRSLKAATEIPCRVFERAATLQAACRAAQRAVKPQFQSDLRCAMAVAMAAAESARTLVLTNLAWLNDPAYSRQVERRLQTAQRSFDSPRRRRGSLRTSHARANPR
jgi:formiminotetrahydrofolate cyclodeaminase